MSALPVFAPASPQARAITDLFYLLLIISAVIFGLVTFLVAYSLVRFRSAPNSAEPNQAVGNKRLEAAWTIGPFLLLVYIFIATARAMNQSDPIPPEREPDMVVTGHQWWWEVRYPASGVVTANDIHIPTGKTLLVRVEAADVIHDFWVPPLSRKMDMVPGHPNHIWLRADRPEAFLGFCAEYCGAQHAGMRFRVTAQSPPEFERWQEAQRQPPSPPDTPAALQGQKLFSEMTCANCHAPGAALRGPQAAPDLTHLSGRKMLAAEVLENTPANLKAWLRDPQRFKPGCLMPNLRLSNEQADALVAYLEALK